MATKRLTAIEKADNAHRIERADEVIFEYAERWDRGEDDETTIIDLLADLKHKVGKMAGRKDPNGFLMFERLLDAAHRHYFAEVYGE